MKKDYLVSVIVPVYEAEKYIVQCIESIQAQTHSNLEIVLVDDGSTDTSLQICTEYASRDSRIRVIHQSNKGVSAARNAGLDIITGDYYTFVDSDDELYPNAVELLLNNILAYHADIASCVKDTIAVDGSVASPYANHMVKVYSGLDMLELSLDGERQTNSACAKLFNRNKFSSIRFENGKSINEDGYYLFQCYTLKPCVIQHNESIYKYYIRSNSNSRNTFSEKYFDMLYFAERKKEIVNSNFPELKEKLITMEVSAHLFFLEILCRTCDKKYKKAQDDSILLVKKFYRVFQCINQHERRIAWIVAHGLYPLYKWVVRLKYYR